MKKDNAFSVHQGSIVHQVGVNMSTIRAKTMILTMEIAHLAMIIIQPSLLVAGAIVVSLFLKLKSQLS